MSIQLGGPTLYYDPHFVSGARIGIRSLNGKWRANLFATNLFDEHFPVALFPASGTINVITSERTFRQIGISLDFNF